jgi:choline dehydrogenase-like flavoprotein
VPDASWFPTSIRVNPQVTIMAFATLAAREIAEALHTPGRARSPVSASLT